MSERPEPNIHAEKFSRTRQEEVPKQEATFSRLHSPIIAAIGTTSGYGRARMPQERSERGVGYHVPGKHALREFSPWLWMLDISPSLAPPRYKVVPIQYALALAVRRAFCFQF
jgi:hypothetical protein